MIRLRCLSILVALGGCSTVASSGAPSTDGASQVSGGASEGSASASSDTTSAISAASPSPSGTPASSQSTASAAAVDASHPDALSADDVERILFPHATAGFSLDRCPRGESGDARIRCLLGLRFTDDDAARQVALDLFTQSGSVAGVEREQTMDGGFRGKIHLVPEPPIGKYRRHLEWVAAANRDFEHFFADLGAHAKAPIGYRWRALAYKFLRSVGRTTPSAYAQDWSIAYNVSGSLHGSAEAVRETLFHEIFHLNDDARHWSRPAIGALYDGIVARCGTKTACLAPFAPNDTMVRGGTYYAFQPDNGDGVHEYAAELAIRYFREHRSMLRHERLAKPPFKCGPEENARSWKLLVDTFFGGVDLVPPC